ncbi:MAG: hypothetical protein NTV46_06875 [Verrucomicrobia bacterium]|nr:hypothetical protein [Verrucomicrobiota bacterium]
MSASFKISKIKKREKTVFRVYTGTDPVTRKKRYKQFRTNLEAGVWVKNEKVRQLAHGRITSGLDGAVVSNWSRLEEELASLGTSLAEVGREAVKRLTKVTKRGTARECFTAFAEMKIRESSRPRYLGDLRKKANAFLRSLPEADQTQMRAITEPEVTNYLDNLRTSKTDRLNHERTLGVWMRWAYSDGWMGADPMPRRPKGQKTVQTTHGEAVTLTPKEVSKLLNACVSSQDWTTLSFVALAVFAGIRPEAEFRKRIIDPKTQKRRTVTLNWADIKPGGIAIASELSKTGVPRMVPVQPVLSEWLDFIKKQAAEPLSGPVVAGHWPKHWTDWRKANWPHVWHQDQLRHSFGNYRLAVLKNANAVALEMGNSAAVVLKHYWRWETLEPEALEFWALTPQKIVEKKAGHP